MSISQSEHTNCVVVVVVVSNLLHLHGNNNKFWTEIKLLNLALKMSFFPNVDFESFSHFTVNYNNPAQCFFK